MTRDGDDSDAPSDGRGDTDEVAEGVGDGDSNRDTESDGWEEMLENGEDALVALTRTSRAAKCRVDMMM